MAINKDFDHVGYGWYPGNITLDFSPEQIWQMVELLAMNNFPKPRDHTSGSDKPGETTNFWLRQSIRRTFKYKGTYPEQMWNAPNLVLLLQNELISILDRFDVRYSKNMSCGKIDFDSPHVFSITLPAFDMLMLLILSDWFSGVVKKYPQMPWISDIPTRLYREFGRNSEICQRWLARVTEDGRTFKKDYDNLSSRYVLNALKDYGLDRYNDIEKYHEPKIMWSSDMSTSAVTFLSFGGFKESIMEMLTTLGYFTKITTV